MSNKRFTTANLTHQDIVAIAAEVPCHPFTVIRGLQGKPMHAGTRYHLQSALARRGLDLDTLVADSAQAD